MHSYGVDETKQNPIWVVIGRPVTKANKMRILGVLYQQRQQQFCHDWQEWRKRCQRLGINLKARVKHKHKVAGPGNPLISWLQIAAEHPTRPLEETKLLAEEPRLVVDQTLLMVDPMTRCRARCRVSSSCCVQRYFCKKIHEHEPFDSRSSLEANNTMPATTTRLPIEGIWECRGCHNIGDNAIWWFDDIPGPTFCVAK